jgi:Dual OB-containing domain
MTRKTIVVLANSWKKGGRCLAGKEIQLSGGHITSVGSWIRPISSGLVEAEGTSEGGQVTEQTMRSSLSRQQLPSILEILEIPFAEQTSLPDQPENWTMVDGQPWQSAGIFPHARLQELTDAPEKLWDTSGRGWSRVEETLTKDGGFASLYLIAPQGQIYAEVGSRAKMSGSSEVKYYKNLHLNYGSISHEFRISDPAFDAEYKSQFPQLGQYNLPVNFAMPAGTFVTVSLTPAYSYNGLPPRYHYKMAAAIIKPTG